MEIYLTQAGIGDCIIIRCGEAESKINIVVDSGIEEGSFERCFEIIRNNKEQIDMLVFTHDDNDHINGAQCLLNKMNSDTKKDFLEISWERLIFNFGENVCRQLLSARDMHKIAQSALEGGLDFRKIGLVLADDNSEAQKSIIQLRWSYKNGILESEIIRISFDEYLNTDKEHMEIVILSPDYETLKRYINNSWKGIEDIGLSSEIEKHKMNDWENTVQYWLDNYYEIGKDNSISNAASIAFLIHYKEMWGLVAGDAHPDIMIKYARRYLNEIGAKHFDLEFIKLPHHGSSCNVNKEFFDIFRTNKYLLSTKGHKGYKHPGKVTIAEIARNSKYYKDIYIYTNYAWWNSENLKENWYKDIKVIDENTGVTELLKKDGIRCRIHFVKLRKSTKLTEGGITLSM